MLTLLKTFCLSQTQTLHNMEKINNRITQLFKIDYPIIQAGMVWTSGWKLAAAVSNAGGLGIIGAGSMTLEILEEHLQKYYANTQKPLAVNLPLLYSKVEEQMEIILKYKVPIVFTSAGNPAKYTQFLKEKGLIVVHVVSSSTFAIKAEKAGCDAVVAEGFEAGGHNGREETTDIVDCNSFQLYPWQSYSLFGRDLIDGVKTVQRVSCRDGCVIKYQDRTTGFTIKQIEDALFNNHNYYFWSWLNDIQQENPTNPTVNYVYDVWHFWQVDNDHPGMCVAYAPVIFPPTTSPRRAPR